MSNELYLFDHPSHIRLVGKLIGFGLMAFWTVFQSISVYTCIRPPPREREKEERNDTRRKIIKQTPPAPLRAQ